MFVWENFNRWGFTAPRFYLNQGWRYGSLNSEFNNIL